ncbi:MAG: dTDP-4-dehydrorhamnose reductase family protein [Candidatus Binatia bacterium]
MRILVLGVSGMAGHKVYQVFREKDNEVMGVMRGPRVLIRQYPFIDESTVIDNVDVRRVEDFLAVFLQFRPQVVINCIGIVKPRAIDPAETMLVNSVFPHQLARVCSLTGARLIHISTDCVFSGRTGDYSEESTPDCTDLYGRSKLLGEVTEDGHLTIRTSIVGRELGTQRNLTEWFLSQVGVVKGFELAIFTGLTARTLANVLLELARRPEISGLLHVAGAKITKFELLCMLKEAFGRDDASIERYSGFRCDRSLVADRIKALGIRIPDMEIMVREMAAENAVYELPPVPG